MGARRPARGGFRRGICVWLGTQPPHGNQPDRHHLPERAGICAVAGEWQTLSSAGKGLVCTVTSRGDIRPAEPQPVSARRGIIWYLPTSDWRLNQDSLSHPAAHFVSPDQTTVVAAGRDFLEGATSWGVKSSPPIRSFGLGRAEPGRPFYVTDESALQTWAAEVNADGSLHDFRLFAEQGGESVTADLQGNVYVAAGQIYVYDRKGKPLDTIVVPERPVQLAFGGADHQTLFIAARTSLYAVHTRYSGW